MNIHLPEIIIAVCMAAAVSAGSAAPDGEAKLHKYSITIEKERPQLDGETKRLISACRRQNGRRPTVTRLKFAISKILLSVPANLPEPHYFPAFR